MSASRTIKAMSWGRIDRGSEHVVAPRFADRVDASVRLESASGRSVLPVGLRRSYGDSGVNAGNAALTMTRLDHVLAFDSERGIIRVEAGLSLNDLLSVIVPAGWFLPTTPGTRFVTMGGAVANDVHGKNHHRVGSMGAHVSRIAVHRSDRGVVEASASEEKALFEATIGGLGLTGVILWVELRLARIDSSYLSTRTTPFHDLDAYFEINAELSARAEHTVAWIDCVSSGRRFGRGLIMSSDWNDDGRLSLHRSEPKVDLPCDLPSRLLNRTTLAAFNRWYFARQSRRTTKTDVHYEKVFYPLDDIGSWNRLYGKRGFHQYQFVLPTESSKEGIARALKAVVDSGQGSFLAVLKTFGSIPSPGLLSFPMPGSTLALDFPDRGAKTMRLFRALDEIVVDNGGRLYPAKDGRMPRDVFTSGYGHHLERFLARTDPALSSTFWRRVAA